MAALLQTWRTSLSPEVGRDKKEEERKKIDRLYRWLEKSNQQQTCEKKAWKRGGNRSLHTGQTRESSALRVTGRACHCPTDLLWKSRCVPVYGSTRARTQRAVWLAATCLCLSQLCNVCSSPATCMSGSEQQVFCSCLFDPGIHRALQRQHLCLEQAASVFSLLFLFLHILLTTSLQETLLLPSFLLSSLPSCCSCLELYHFSDSFLFHSVCQDERVIEGVNVMSSPVCA